MKALTACDKKYLVEYCKEPKNIELALAIGHIQVQLREEILSSFLEELNESVKEELSKCDLGRQWKTELPTIDLTLEKNENRELSVEGVIYFITTKDPKIKIELKREGGGIFVGTPEQYKDCPQAADLSDYFENTDLKLEATSSNYWRWWAWADPKAKERYTLDDLCILHGESRQKKIEDLTETLVLSATAISKALED